MTSIALAFIAASTTFNLPPGLLSAVCFVESSHRSHVVRSNDGGSDSIGICQVKFSTAQLMGFEGTVEQLKQPKINAHYAAAYLRKQIDRYNGDIVKGVASYNSGTLKADKNNLPVNLAYVRKVLSVWTSVK